MALVRLKEPCLSWHPGRVVVDDVDCDVGVPVRDDLLLDAFRHLSLVFLRGFRLARQQVGRLAELLLLELVDPPGLVEGPLLGEPGLARAGVGGLARLYHEGVHIDGAVVLHVLKDDKRSITAWRT